jgi:hypothetical protein
MRDQFNFRDRKRTDCEKTDKERLFNIRLEDRFHTCGRSAQIFNKNPNKFYHKHKILIKNNPF